MKDVYQVITDRIIDLLEKGTVPWHKTWGGPEMYPRNLTSDKRYRGINAFLLASVAYKSPFWLTYKQAKDRGGNVKKREKGYPCIFWNWIEREEPESGEINKIPFIRYYTVFNVEQCENITYPTIQSIERDVSPIKSCEIVSTEMPNCPTIWASGHVASYSPDKDIVRVPRFKEFKRPEDFYCVLFHELIHSTGHESRLSRPGITETIIFGSHTYGKEELIAEMGATFLCGHTGIENKVIDNSAAYINSWLGKIKNDKKLVIQAAGQAQKASDYILDHKNEI